jgi:Patatin-like phospholipase
VADRTASAAQTAEPSFGELQAFYQVFQREIEIVNARRTEQRRRGPDADKLVRRPTFELETEAAGDVAGQPVRRPPESANVVGLALSGGGIRSAAFCLGVLQALDRAEVLECVDYMSTVSGGGYIGCSLTAGLETAGKFPFASRLEEDEPPALQQIRNYSNYLFPRGPVDLLHNASIYARGLLVNAVLVVPALLAAAAITLIGYAVARSGGAVSHVLHSIFNPFGLRHFFITLELAIALVIVGVGWGVAQSLPGLASQREIPGRWTGGVGILILIFFAVLFGELQPFILDEMIGEGTGNIAKVAAKWIKYATVILAPISAAMSFFANKLGEYVKSLMQSPKWSAVIYGVALKSAIFVAGLVLPILLWIVYLDVTYWGICINEMDHKCAPASLANVSYKLFGHNDHAATLLYFVVALVLIPISLISRPNANSLHPLYRDRLRKAFLFVPKPSFANGDLPEFNSKLSEITGRYGPYHLVNAALNVEHSKTANRRGRNADFFMFSPLFVGSKSTKYARTADVEQVAIGFDFAAAMAVSGAAVSSNMGAQNIRPLTATLALLNIRLGYWLRNPQKLAEAPPPTSLQRVDAVSEFRRKNNLAANYYFLAEIFGLLSENLKSIYLTDGGHIENLGIYELLRRRCRVIIAVDAEADPQMAFGAFNTLERYALIDLGIRIDLPWEAIATESLATGQAIDKAGDVSAEPTGAEGEASGASRKKPADASGDKAGTVPQHHGPHCAIGEISYPGNRKGVLIYIKASLTGDENDYIFDYKRRYTDFPHETTLDQWFTEEQFEAYRALGFHAEKFVDWLAKATPKASGRSRRAAPKPEAEPS